MPTNKDRAQRMQTALYVYSHNLGEGGRVDSDTIRDILADLMHYCNQNDIPFTEELRVATDNYEAEILEETIT